MSGPLTDPSSGGLREPDPGSELEDEGIPDLEDALPSKVITGDAQEGYVPIRDQAVAADDFGTTAYEEEHGESLDGRLARELPDTLSPQVEEMDADDREIADEPFVADREGYDVGRLVESDEGARANTEAEMTARSAGADRGGFSAEESAMHIDPDS